MLVSTRTASTSRPGLRSGNACRHPAVLDPDGTGLRSGDEADVPLRQINILCLRGASPRQVADIGELACTAEGEGDEAEILRGVRLEHVPGAVQGEESSPSANIPSAVVLLNAAQPPVMYPASALSLGTGIHRKLVFHTPTMLTVTRAFLRETGKAFCGHFR